MKARLLFYYSLLAFSAISTTVKGQSDYRRQSRAWARSGSSTRRRTTYQHANPSDNPDYYVATYYGMSFIPCQQIADQIDISFPYQRGTNTYTYQGQILIPGMSARIPTYDLSIEMGNSKRFFGGANLYMVNANLPNSRLDSNMGAAFSLGYNFRVADRMLISFSSAVGTQWVSTNSGTTIPDQDLDVIALGNAFNGRGKRQYYSQNDDVHVGIREKTDYLKFKIELNCRISKFSWIYVNAGILTTMNKSERVILNNDHGTIQFPLNARDLTVNTQVPINHLFDFRGASCSFGIVFRLGK